MVRLYKKFNGSVLVWEIDTYAHSLGVDIQTLSYKYGNKPRKNTTTIKSGKNQGKANATTAQEQADKEKLSRINKKLKEGYVNITIPPLVVISGETEKWLLDNLTEGVDHNGLPKPMLAGSFYKPSKNYTDKNGKFWKDRKYFYLINPPLDAPKEHIGIKLPACIQPKLNGIRCFIAITETEISLTSKEGNKLTVDHITKEVYHQRNIILEHFKTNRVILDGELYLHGHSLETIISSIKGEVDMFTPKVEFHCYDFVDTNKPFSDRSTLIYDLYLEEGSEYLKQVETYYVDRLDEVQRWTDDFIAKGYEGSIIRNQNAVYAPNKRIASIMAKLKRTISEEYKITNIIPQDKDDTLGLFVFRSKDGDFFEITPTYSEEKCRAFLKYREDFVGKSVTLTFYEYTEKGIPKHNMSTIIRDYE